VSAPPIRLAGYAALFDRVDAARDIILPGAFARSLAERRGPLPLYWQHRPDQVIGAVELVQEDRRGLRVIARLHSLASRAASALRNGTVSGLSFGYRARVYRLTPEGRLLEDVDLFEVSLVTHPLQHRARVHLVQ
jgi:HK97 family phage prohead protease